MTEHSAAAFSAAGPTQWSALAARARVRRRATAIALYGALIVSALPVLIPYLWMVTISLSATSGTVDTSILWQTAAVLLVAAGLGVAAGRLRPGRRRTAYGIVVAGALFSLAFLVGPALHGNNFRFLWNPNLIEEIRGVSGAGGGQFPSVWTAFGNSLLLAGLQTAIVVVVATLAGYGVSRFAFAGRERALKTLLVLHAFPAMTLIIPIFLMLHWVGLLDTIVGVVLVICTLELPFAIFIMKGFFDAVPWEIEMSALTDGATRRQAFLWVVLPHVRVGVIAIAIFAFIKGWEEYVFVATLLLDKSNWVMSLYLFWVADDIMGVDYGIVAAVSVFYMLPSTALYIFTQKHLTRMTVGGIRG